MTMANGDHLLSTTQMAQFAARGVLEFPAIVPANINAAYLDMLGADGVPGVPAGTPLSRAYAEGSPIRAFVETPAIEGIIRSLVGKDPLVDHHFSHVAYSPATMKTRGFSRPQDSQHWHQDSTIDTRQAFDIQLMWYPHEVTREMGGTRYLPGSHLRIVSEAAIGRYQNIAGQRHVVCPAGTVLALHHGLWHGGGANRGEADRYMFKLRLNPQGSQERLWDASDLEARHGPQQPIFHLVAPRANDDLASLLLEPQPWYEADTGRLELINRIRLWRYLSGDARFDADYWLGRLENQPGRRVETAG
jgi:Phytanoyl-CoA dioxygenase (PhyH)